MQLERCNHRAGERHGDSARRGIRLRTLPAALAIRAAPAVILAAGACYRPAPVREFAAQRAPDVAACVQDRLAGAGYLFTWVDSSGREWHGERRLPAYEGEDVERVHAVIVVPPAADGRARLVVTGWGAHREGLGPRDGYGDRAAKNKRPNNRAVLVAARVGRECSDSGAAAADG